MSAEPTLAFWTHALLLLTLGATVVVGLAALVARWPPSAAGRRTVWQAAALGLAGLLVAELSGLAGEAGGWLDRRLSPSSGAVPAGRALPPSADGTPAPLARAELDRAGTPEEAPGGDKPETVSRAGTPAAAVWWPGALWLAGALAVAARVGLARVLLVAFRRRHRPAADPALLERVRAIAARVGLRRRVLVLESDGLVGPVAFGLLRPTVALPTGFAGRFGPAQQEVILAHELTHLAAGDPAWHLLAELVTAALWWQPLAWWARQQLRTAAEMAADESSLVVADGPAVLARCLVELGGVLAGTRSAGWLHMAGSGFRSGLGRRVERLVRLDGRPWRPPRRARALATLALVPAALLAAAVLCTAWARARAFPEGDEPMRHPWKRSLAGLVLVAALGPNTGPGLAGDPPPAHDPNSARPAAPAAGAEQTPPPETPPAAAPDAAQDTVREQLLRTENALQKLDSVKKDLNVKLLRDGADQDTKKEVEDQLRDVQAKAAKLAEEKAALEAKLRALDEKKDDAAIHIKVLRLTHQDPEETRGVIEALLNRQNGPPPMAGGGAGGMGPMGGRGGGRRAGAGMMQPGMGMGGMMGPGGMPGGMGRPETSWHLAVDPRSRSLIVRGTAKDIETVADLVALLDVPEGKSPPRLKDFRIFRLRYADPHEVAGILGALDISAVVVPAPGARAVVVSGPEAALKEVGEVIEAVDVEGKPTPPLPAGRTGPP